MILSRVWLKKPSVSDVMYNKYLDLSNIIEQKVTLKLVYLMWV